MALLIQIHRVLADLAGRQTPHPKEQACQSAISCTTSVLGPDNTLEQAASSANARFFRPFLLPPGIPPSEGPQHQPPASFEHILNHQQTLGSNPCLGRRAAVHYRLNRGEWERRAARRM